MQPIRMTRAEYEAKYGTQPVIATSTLDTTPAPIRMTRAEYNALYRPTEPTDWQQMRTAQTESVIKGAEEQGRIIERQKAGEISTPKALFQRFTKGLGTASSVIGDTIVGGLKMAAPQSVEKFFSEYGAALGERARQEFADAEANLKAKAEAGEKDAQEALKFAQEVKSAYLTDETFRTDVQGAGGLLEWIALPGTTKTVSKSVTETVKEAADAVVPEVTDVLKKQSDNIATWRNDSRVANVANEIEAIENKYAPLRKKAEVDPMATESRARIAQSNVLQNAVDENGLIRTKEKGGAIDTYRANTIDGLEDVVKRNLEIENKKINLAELQDDMTIALSQSGLEGADLIKAIKSIDNELKGLKLRADEFGDVPLAKLQDVKTSIYKHIDWTKPTGITYRKTLARVYKEAIENKSDLDVKAWNKELSKYYNDLDRLASLDGRLAKGGRLGKYTASLAGSAVGGLAGTAAGAPGALVGGILGGEVSGFLKGKAMSRTFNKGVKGEFRESPVLKSAKEKADLGVRDLKKADGQVGVPKEILDNPKLPATLKKDIQKVEGQIKQNIKQQNAAIKAGDFTLVATLKDVYAILHAKLIEFMRQAKDVLGDERGFANFFGGETPKNYRLNRNAKNSLMFDQKKAISAPTNAQAISKTVTPDANSVKTNIGDITRTTPEQMAADLVQEDIAMANKLMTKSWKEIDNTERVEFMKKYNITGATEENVKPFLKEALDAYDERWGGVDVALEGKKSSDIVRKDSLLEGAKGKTLDEFIAAQQKGLLFHGTGEVVDKLKPVSDDVGILWTANKMDVAELYIPDAREKIMVNLSEFKRKGDQPFFKETQGSPSWVFGEKGKSLGVKTETTDGVTATKQSADEILKLLESKGIYDEKSSSFIIGAANKVPAGKLYQLKLKPGEKLKIKDLRRDYGLFGEEMADTDRLEDFLKAKQEGYDGVRILDFNHSSSGETILHESYGLFESGLKKVDQSESAMTTAELKKIWDKANR